MFTAKLDGHIEFPKPVRFREDFERRHYRHIKIHKVSNIVVICGDLPGRVRMFSLRYCGADGRELFGELRYRMTATSHANTVTIAHAPSPHITPEKNAEEKSLSVNGSIVLEIGTASIFLLRLARKLKSQSQEKCAIAGPRMPPAQQRTPSSQRDCLPRVCVSFFPSARFSF
jgi:hypothetical protein